MSIVIVSECLRPTRASQHLCPHALLLEMVCKRSHNLTSLNILLARWHVAKICQTVCEPQDPTFLSVDLCNIIPSVRPFRSVQSLSKSLSVTFNPTFIPMHGLLLNALRHCQSPGCVLGSKECSSQASMARIHILHLITVCVYIYIYIY